MKTRQQWTILIGFGPVTFGIKLTWHKKKKTEKKLTVKSSGDGGMVLDKFAAANQIL